MFSGIVREVGQISSIEKNDCWRIKIDCPLIAPNIKEGDSISVDGVCLTAVSSDDRSFLTDVMPESLRKTIIEHYSEGSHVNIEPALKASDSLDGHMVLGHIDGTGSVANIKKDGDDVIITCQVPSELKQYLVYKGCVALQGVSLTVSEVTDNGFSVCIIPYTLEHTNLSTLKEGDPVNVEMDVIGKYVVSYMKQLQS